MVQGKRMGPVEWALLITLSVLWGGSFFFSKVALAELRPLSIVLGRVALAAVALNLLVMATGNRMPGEPQRWSEFALMGLINNAIPFSLIVWGQSHIASGLAAILNATTPLWTVLLAHLLTTDERLSANRLGGVLAGVLGVAVMIGPAALGGGVNALAQAAVIGAAFAYGCAGIYGRRFRGLPPLVAATGQVTCSALIMAPLALLVDQPWQRPAPSPGVWAALIAIALLSTALAYIIYFRLLASAGATNLLLVTLLIPVSATLFGVGILGERLDPRHLAGMALIALGLAAIDGRLVHFIVHRRNAEGAKSGR